MALRVLWALGFCALYLLNLVAAEERNRGSDGGFMDRLTNGMQLANDFLGSESVARKVAEFVVKAFQTAAPVTKTKGTLNLMPEKSDQRDGQWANNNDVESSMVPLGGLRQVVKLFGLQPSQITAVAVNALLFVAQMISSLLSGPQRPTKQRFEDSQSWILSKKSRRLQAALATAKNDSLPGIIEEILTKQHPDEETACIQLLICKLTPFVTKMQRTVFGSDVNEYRNGVGAQIMYRNLPSKEEINASHSACEMRYRDCDLNEY